MVHKVDDTVRNPKYNFLRKGGRSIIDRRPVFSADGELAVIVENTVRVYNTETSDCVRVLETESHTDHLIAIEFPESDSYNLYGCSYIGCVTIWMWENGAVLREVKLNIPENVKVLTFNLINSTDCVITAGSPLYSDIHFGAYSLKTGEIIHNYELRLRFYDMVSVALGSFNGDRIAVLTNGSKKLCIQNLSKSRVFNEMININHIRITSVAAHDGIVATGDALGRVVIIRGDLFNNRHIGRETLHWHFLPVLSVTFSLQGNYLYSAGMEKVVLKWTIANVAYKVADKQFMPRLPGIVRFLSANQTNVAISLSNNSIVIGNAQLWASCTILECGGLSPVMRAIGGSLVYHSKLAGLLLPGRTGHLQLYSTTTDKVLYNVDIVQMNDLPAERYNLLPIGTEITCVAVSNCGDWLATSEYRNDGINFPEEKLKFWKTTVKGPTPFILNTLVNLSHGGFKVVALAFDANGEYCISAGDDQKFRIWKKENVSLTQYKKLHYTCISACYYSTGISQFLSHDMFNQVKRHNVDFKSKSTYPYMKEIGEGDIILKLANIHKEHLIVDSKVLDRGMSESPMGMGGVAISQDGSLIAAWFGCKLTLWDTHLCTLRTTLSHPALRPKGIQVQFGKNDSGHYLVCTTENCLAVWSLLSLTIKWYVQIRPSCLTSDVYSNRMAVVTQDNDVFVFLPQIQSPILTKKRLLDPETGVFKQMTFAKTNDGSIKLFLMRNNSEIYTIEPEKKEESRLEVISWSNKPMSKFGALMAVQHLSEVQNLTLGETEQLDSIGLANSAVAQLSSADPHMVPPVSLLCTSFLQQISGSQDPVEESDNPDDTPMEVDLSSDDEDDHKLNKHTPKAMELWTPNYEAIKAKKIIRIMKEPFLDLHSTSALFGV